LVVGEPGARVVVLDLQAPHPGVLFGEFHVCSTVGAFVGVLPSSGGESESSSSHRFPPPGGSACKSSHRLLPGRPARGKLHVEHVPFSLGTTWEPPVFFFPGGSLSGSRVFSLSWCGKVSVVPGGSPVIPVTRLVVVSPT